jgi:hypothetical protein
MTPVGNDRLQTGGQVCRLQLLLVLASAVILTAHEL